ncbi:MAG: SAM-dependent methyltransferase [Bacteroidetes bacterium]|nr:MAG: SAM-dependent methyltransferase [Bacteroidota bacterium]
MRPALYLIPTPLGEQAIHTIPAYVIRHLHALRHFVAERARTARRFIKATDPPFAIAELHIEELNEHTPPDAIGRLLAPVRQGHPLGLLSEAGCPAVADPGALLVRQAHEEGIEVVPLVGPSSLLLALMASGFNGQQFTFHGYLPRKKDQLVRVLRRLEQEVQRHGHTQLFIEAPYRNVALFETMLQTLSPATALCIACDLTLETEWIRTRAVAQWQASPPPDLHKRPAVFLIGRSG